jgi:glyoxylase I family protein
MSDIERPPQWGVDHLGISVTDLARSEAFYCGVLGANVIFGRHKAAWGQRTVVALGLHAVDLNQFSGNNGTRFDPTQTGLDHLGLKTGSLEELEEWAKWLDKKGIARSPIREVRLDPQQDSRAPAVGAIFDFVDPDGIQLEFLFIAIE